MPFAFPPGSPYLPPGLHAADVDDVEATLVNGFAASATRRGIFEHWKLHREAVSALVTLGVTWLDGSYVTTKDDPSDADIVVHLDGAEVDALDPADELALQALVAGPATKAAWRCDSYPLVEYPVSHPLRSFYEQQRAYWEDWFGHDRGGQAKGIVEVAP